jgi:hypothetical protein
MLPPKTSRRTGDSRNNHAALEILRQRFTIQCVKSRNFDHAILSKIATSGTGIQCPASCSRMTCLGNGHAHLLRWSNRYESSSDNHDASFLSCSLASAQHKGFPSSNHSGASTAVQMVVTAEPFRDTEIPSIPPDGVSVLQGPMPVPLTEWLPLRGDNASLEFYGLIDERVNPNKVMLFD